MKHIIPPSRSRTPFSQCSILGNEKAKIKIIVHNATGEYSADRNTPYQYNGDLINVDPFLELGKITVLASCQVVSYLHEETCTSTAYANERKNTYDKLRSDWPFYHLLKSPNLPKKTTL